MSKRNRNVSFLEKVKTGTSQVAGKGLEVAHDAQRIGQAKYGEFQLRRKVDGLLRELGLVYYFESIEPNANNKAEIQRLLGELRDLDDGVVVDLRKHQPGGEQQIIDGD